MEISIYHLSSPLCPQSAIPDDIDDNDDDIDWVCRLYDERIPPSTHGIRDNTIIRDAMLVLQKVSAYGTTVYV